MTGERQPGERVVVTGGAGFIGTHTTRALLEAGASVMVIDDLRHACGEPVADGVRLVRADVSSREAAAALSEFRPDGVIHLAAQGGVSRSVRDPAADALVNVVGSVALIKACLDAGCERLVFSSSGGAIYGSSRRLPSFERDTPHPLSPYGAAKLATEGYLGMFRRTFNLSTIALRYANIYGPYQDGSGEAGVVAITCHRLNAGTAPQITGDGGQTRDFTFVGDVARANVLALRSRSQGAFNIGTGVATPVASVAAILARLAGFGGGSVTLPGRPGEVRHTQLSVEKARRHLGWSATTALDEGLAVTLRSFRDRQPPA
ncbi:MAG TPA: NAD-dependent epimerase/dehydratase family protein [Candidatus Micrarchaeia archaeon]|nr:NAD-dependent epimerase/dehydratase family protein [Candidatus Micrarchaeia archaeon]